VSRKKRLRIYLCSGMEKSENLGAGWRDKITPFLEELDFEVWNPVQFEADQLRGLHPHRLPSSVTDSRTGKQFTPSYWHDLKRAKEKQYYDRFLKYMRRIREYDLNLVENEMDYLLVYWNDGTGNGAGSHAEIEMAHRVGLPVYCVSVTDVPAWLHPCIDEMFYTMEELKEFLEKEIKG